MRTSASYLAEISVRSPENSSFSLHDKIFSGSKYPGMILFSFENSSTGAHLRLMLDHGHVEVQTLLSAKIVGSLSSLSLLSSPPPLQRWQLQVRVLKKPVRRMLLSAWRVV